MAERFSGSSDIAEESLQGERSIDQLKIDIEQRLRHVRDKKFDAVYKEANDELRKQDHKRQAISEPLSAYTKRMIVKEQSLLRHIFGISAAIVFVASLGFSLVVAIT